MTPLPGFRRVIDSLRGRAAQQSDYILASPRRSQTVLTERVVTYLHWLSHSFPRGHLQLRAIIFGKICWHRWLFCLSFGYL